MLNFCLLLPMTHSIIASTEKVSATFRQTHAHVKTSTLYQSPDLPVLVKAPQYVDAVSQRMLHYRSEKNNEEELTSLEAFFERIRKLRPALAYPQHLPDLVFARPTS